MGWASLIGSIVGLLGRQNEAEQGQKMTAADLARMEALGIPPAVLMTPEQLGTPQAAVADPRLQQALFAALNKMQQWGTGALNTEDKMAMSLAMDEAARRGQIAQSGIEQQMQAKGQGGSGALLGMKASAAQNSEQNAYNAGIQRMLAAQERGFQANAQAGSLASNMSAQDMARKQALDRIAAANAGARQQAQQYNLGVPWRQYEAGMDKEAVLRGIGRYGQAQSQAASQQRNTTLANIGAGVGQMGEERGWWGGSEKPQQKPAEEEAPYGYDAYGQPLRSV